MFVIDVTLARVFVSFGGKGERATRETQLQPRVLMHMRLHGRRAERSAMFGSLEVG